MTHGDGNLNFKPVKRLLKLTIGAALISSLNVNAQNLREPKRDYVKPQDRVLIDLHNVLLTNPAEGMNQRMWSPGFNAWVMHNLSFGKSNFALAIGYGFSAMHVHLNGNFERPSEEPTAMTNFRAFDDGYSWSKHKIATNYIEAPVELRFRTKTPTPFKFALGAQIGYLVSSHTKTIDESGKRKAYTVEGIEPLRYGLTGRIGAGRFSIYGHYLLSRWVNSPAFLPLQPVTVGISIQLI